MLNELKGTDAYNEALKITHRAKSGRDCDKPIKGVLLFGKKGNDFVFKIGNKATDDPQLLTAEQALTLFEANESEEPQKVSDKFDAVYQNIKSKLFRGTSSDKNEKEKLKAMDKLKHIKATQSLDADYIEDLIRVVESDGLSGFEIRYINSLTPKDYCRLPKEIDQNYLNRIISTSNSIVDGDEVLILAEELQ